MKETQELMIWSMVGLGLLLYIGTFIVVWNSTADYRANIARPLAAQSETIRTGARA